MKQQKKMLAKTWHEKHQQKLNFGQRTADRIAHAMGSWWFIVTQTIIIIIWIIFNLIAIRNQWDPYPFILLNLLFSTQGAYAAPIIMISQNRQGERDRHQALEDYVTNIEAKKEIEDLQKSLARIENIKLDQIMVLLKKYDK